MIAKSTQTSRSNATRKHTERKVTYTPHNDLDAPKPHSSDMKYRWIRVQTVGEDDTRNISRRRREGYEFVRKEAHPDTELPVHEGGKFAGVIGSGDLVLAKIPKDFVDARNTWTTDRTKRQQRAVDENMMREQHPSMPISQNKDTSVSTGNKPKFDN